MQAITTKYLGPTNRRGSRIKATCQARSITVPCDDRLNSELNHRQAARALADKLGWSGRWIGGGLPNGGYVYLLDDSRVPAETFTINGGER